ncbi:hypothetical protein BD779DRAFT_589178 [Infundibulicybe gibba]|nr:hypothetical protein BD779DRAFT_589178 [Infundibulicybe gibba]
MPIVASPTEAAPAEVFDQVNASLPEPPLPGTRENIPISTSSAEPEVTDGQQSRRPKSNSAIAARIQAYERRLSLSQETPSPTNTKQHEERSKRPNQIQYGLAPRPSLFVANPDHNNRASGDS